MVNDVFPFVEIILPLVMCGILVVCCASICKGCLQAQQEQLDFPDRPSIFIVPIPNEDQPPRYSTTETFSLPPPYAEVEMKPHQFPIPEELPPAYTEVAPPLSPTTPPLTTPPLPSRSVPLRRMSYA